MRRLGTIAVFSLLTVVVWGCSGGTSLMCPPVEDTQCQESEVVGDTADTTGGQDALTDTIPDFSGKDWGADVVMPDGWEVDMGDLCSEAPYGFNCPCDDNSECAEGYCVEGPVGFVCTTECLEECPDGWTCKGISGYGADPVFVCMPQSKKICYPCTVDTQCGAGKCVPMDDGSFCSVSCSQEEPCPGGFECVALPQIGANYSACVPASGSCYCMSENEGELRPCTKSNEYGQCQGFETCDPELGFVGCTAEEAEQELCDGKDNDCDGMYDEELAASQPCETTVENVGTCKGLSTCQGVNGWVCSAPAPTQEVCDYADNNCDGVVDDSFVDAQGRYTTYEYCGSCYVSCAQGFPNATARCDGSKEPPRCVVDVCAPGYYKLNEFQCVPNFAALCEPCTTDDNCLMEGAKCIELVDGHYCSKHCEASDECPQGYHCEPYEDEEGALDNQCMPDTYSCTCTGEASGLSKSCSAMWPPAPEPGESFITCYGTQLCSDDGWSDCMLPDEECNSLDDDCNGVVDDGFQEEGRYFTDANCGQCGNSCLFLTYANATGYCDVSLVVPQCAMECTDTYFDVNNNPADGCECHYTSGSDLPGGGDENCDGVDGEVQNALFVAKNGSDSNSGSIYEPMLTIQAAINRANTTGPKSVYVATGVYTQSLLLAGSVSIYGGYSSDFLQRDPVLYETVIMGEAFSAQKPGAVNALDITGAVGATVVDGFTVYGKNNNAIGGSSYAVYIRNGTNTLDIRHNHIIGGAGGPGPAGTKGTDGTSGAAGGAGLTAYAKSGSTCTGSSVQNAGGAGAAKSCGSTNVGGGSGGSNYCPDYGVAPPTGATGVDGLGGAPGDGGSAGYDAIFYYSCGTCSVPSTSQPMHGGAGVNGGDGAKGSAGTACSGNAGSVAAGLWTPSVGGNGAAGTHGSGGGGGGAGGGAEVDSDLSCAVQIGGSGGGGGSGACGGTGGNGGGSGGGSFGVFLVWTGTAATVPSMANNLIEGGAGGTGGAGGPAGTGGAGGAGGNGGLGEAGDAWCALGGGAGGKGGNGGHGGGGGGGCGGVSYSIYASGQGTVSLISIKSNNSLVIGTGGAGGAGGPSMGNAGQAGGNFTAVTSNF